MSQDTTAAELFEFEEEEEGLEVGYTTLQNLFFTHFMPQANGNYVKVYLAGLMRCYGSKRHQWASVKTIANEQQLSERTVQRAWTYWEEIGLVRRVPRYLRDKRNPLDYKTTPDDEYRFQTTNIIAFRRNLLPLVQQQEEGQQQQELRGDNTDTPRVTTLTPGGGDTADTQRITNTKELQIKQDKTKSNTLNEHCKEVMSGLDGIAVTKEEEANTITQRSSTPAHHQHQYGKEEVEEENVTKALSSYEVHLNQQPSPADRKIIVQLLGEYGLEWFDAALVELTVQQVELGKKIKSPLRFVKGILRNWATEGGVNLTPVSV